MSDELNNIDEILKEFQKQKEDRNKPDRDKKDDKKPELIDFAKTEPKKNKKDINDDPLGILSNEELISDDDEPKDKKDKKSKKPKKAKKDKSPKNKITIDKKKAKKIGLIAGGVVLAIAIIIGAIFGGRAIKERNAKSYLIPYQEKYPAVAFPEGILEKYCDEFGQNPTAVCHLTIDDIELSMPVRTLKDKKTPYAEICRNNSEAVNHVIYMPDNTLEQYYKDADSYNGKATGIMTYSNFITEDTYKVVGAFYTNTRPEDDQLTKDDRGYTTAKSFGYIFPYNCVEKQTVTSMNKFVDGLNKRFIYSTSVTIKNDDELLTISCPTDYRENFRFVIVAVKRDNADKLTATNKTDNAKIHVPNVIYQENNQHNPYGFSNGWYPEIVYIDQAGKERAYQLSLDDFNKEH